MRLGVLDIGSNTVHLLVADAHPGGRPLASTSHRSVLRLMRYVTPDGAISEDGIAALVDAVTQARASNDYQPQTNLVDHDQWRIGDSSLFVTDSIQGGLMLNLIAETCADVISEVSQLEATNTWCSSY